MVNKGLGNTGFNNIGDRNNGNWNIGEYNDGNRNTGDHNIGYLNTGDRNTGDHNIGHNNSGYWNIGRFNAKSPKISMFDKPSNWTLFDWLCSDAKGILDKIPSENYKRQEWWDKLTENSKESIISIPNFDKAMFLKITGIKIEDETIDKK